MLFETFAFGVDSLVNEGLYKDLGELGESICSTKKVDNIFEFFFENSPPPFLKILDPRMVRRINVSCNLRARETN